jgi:hypothetical protein
MVPNDKLNHNTNPDMNELVVDRITHRANLMVNVYRPEFLFHKVCKLLRDDLKKITRFWTTTPYSCYKKYEYSLLMVLII